MTIANFLLAEAQPNYTAQVTSIAARWEAMLPSDFSVGLDNDNFVPRLADLIESADYADDEILQLISDLWSLTWWRGPKIDDDCSRRIIGRAVAIFRNVFDRPNLPQPTVARSKARKEHSVFVGTLQDPLHSPSRGAIDYVAVLAMDPAIERIDIYYSGSITPRLQAYIDERLGPLIRRRGIRFFCVDVVEDLLSDVVGRGACTFHFWCEPALSPWIGLMSLFGPTVMFVCGDEAPVQYADVYWYFHQPDYVAERWARRGAPQSFIKNYVFSQSGPTLIEGRPTPRKRQPLGWNENNFIMATVGNRLGIDLDEAFVNGMEAILKAHPECVWLVVGALPEHLVYAFEQGFGFQFRHIPFEPALSELMTLVDVFANPFRPGGGNSANNALSAGSVLLTLDEGDVASLVPAEHRATDQVDYFERLLMLVEEPSKMDAWRELQQNQHSGLVDQNAFLGSLISMTGLAYERFLARRMTPLTQVIDGQL
ncbi:MAG: hypothetical protein RJA87_793 [Pseudomonadota bacterium]|jgi:hypothetical protein